MDREKAVLVGLHLETIREERFTSSLSELNHLAETAGLDVVDEVTQKRRHPDQAYYIGRGKTEVVREQLEHHGATLLLIDSELSPVQLRNLENVLQVDILDRTALILDIFARRAQSREGKLQVELARLEYQLPRLTGRGFSMSRQAGGIGARGAGEQKLELDRRYIRRRIHELKKQIRQLEKTRSLHRERRNKTGVPTVSLVGYTNAGKSTLFNTLYYQYGQKSADEQSQTEDQLFKTLDITTRAVWIDQQQRILISDTVGFIQNLPHKLVDAFKGTLEEAVRADLILHVVDASHPQWEQQTETVEEVLHQLDVGDRPCVTVYNKVDRLASFSETPPDAIAVSGRYKRGIDELVNEIKKRVQPEKKVVRLFLPYAEASLYYRLSAEGDVIHREEGEYGWDLKVMLPEKRYGQWKETLSPYCI